MLCHLATLKIDPSFHYELSLLRRRFLSNRETEILHTVSHRFESGKMTRGLENPELFSIYLLISHLRGAISEILNLSQNVWTRQ